MNVKIRRISYDNQKKKGKYKVAIMIQCANQHYVKFKNQFCSKKKANKKQ